MGGEQGSFCLMLVGQGMGQGDLALRQKLLRTYLTLLMDDGVFPQAVGFITEGVYLVTEGSPVLDLLRSLQERGVELIICQTCLKHYELAGKVQVGVVGGMGDILAAQMRAAKVVAL